MCQRFRQISYEEKLWSTLNLSDKKIPIAFIEQILIHGTKYLSLAGTKIYGEKLESVNRLSVERFKIKVGISQEHLLCARTYFRTTVCHLVYDRNHYFGLGPIPKLKPTWADTFGQYCSNPY